MRTATGLDLLAAENFSSLRGETIGLLCNQAAVDHGYRHILDRMLPSHRAGEFKIGAVFGPQHGLFGHTQDNMIEWEGAADPRIGIPVYSLYGTHREPTPTMLADLDRLVVDVQDVGSRYYTFAWTMANCLNACAERGIPVTVLDRPNPIGGVQVEGPVLDPDYASFVGLYPLPTRHGLTLGEIASHLRDRYFPSAVLSVVPVRGWEREAYLDETDAPWAMPSPNMPTVDTALVYPGGCLLEGTNLSEGRGTTRPFETLGAPFLDGWKLAEALNRLALTGVTFRPLQFEPTFNKHRGRVCEGVFLHVTDRRRFRPVAAFVAVIMEAVRQTGLHALPDETPVDDRFSTDSADCALPGFAWKRPPYEYETERPPIDILAGNGWLRAMIESLAPLGQITERMASEKAEFAAARAEALLY